MAYKVLGQATATAAAASTAVNLIKDPSFEGISKAFGAYVNASTSTWDSIAGTQWYANPPNGYSSNSGCGSSVGYTQTDATNTVDYLYGTNGYAMGSVSNAGTNGVHYLSYGLAISGYTQGATNSTAWRGTKYAIPVNASTTYYFGADCAAGTNYGINFNVIWFNSAGTYVGSSTGNAFTATAGAGWTKSSFSATSPSTAAYAGIWIDANLPINGTYIYAKFDGIYFGTDSTYATAFKDPNNPTNLLLNSGFTSKYSGVWSGTANNSTQVTIYAGAPVLLYTVPTGKSTVVSTVTAANCSPTTTTYRVAVVPSGQTLAAKHWVIFDGTLTALQTGSATIGMTLAAGDMLYVASDLASTAFTAFGNEA